MKNRQTAFALSPLALATASLLPVAFASTEAGAQDSGVMLEEVIVTAQKKAENVQDIPATINAVSAQQIEEFAVLEFEDLSTLVPGLDLQKADARRQLITIRGITADPDNVAKQPITTYMNEVAVRQQVIFSAVYDIERVEVLRGPQGTLQGRTDPAGAILNYTKRPNTSEFDGYIQQTFTDQPGSNTQFGASLPVIEDKLGFRVSGVYDDNEGQQYENVTNGQEESHRTKSARASMDWFVTDNIEWALTYQYTDRNVAFPEAIYGDLGDYTNLTAPNSPVVADPNYPQSLDKEDRTAIHQGLDSNSVEINLVTSQFNWDLGPGALTWVAGFYDIQQDNVLDRDISNVYPLPQRQQTLTDLQYYTTEFRWSSNEGLFDGFWDYTVGAFWERTDTQTDNSVDASGSAALFLPPVPGGIVNALSIPIQRENISIYNHNTFHFTDTLNLQVGWRYQEARVDAEANNTLTILPGVTPTVPGGSVVESALIPAGLTTEEDEALTGSIKLAWFVAEQTMLYGSIDSSYRPPGVGISPTPLSAENLLFDKETSVAYELGFKSTFADGRMRLNGSWFFQQYDGYQARATDVNAVFYDDLGAPDPTKVQGGITFNADATVQGAELELQSLLTDTWTLNAGGAYVDSRFDDGAEGPCNRQLTPAEVAQMVEVATCDIGGERVSAQPLFSGNINSEYYLPFGSAEWYLRGLYDYRTSSSFYLIDEQTIKAYGTFSFWTGFRSQDGSWDVNAWVKNAFDEQQLAVLSNREFVSVPQIGLLETSNWRRATMIQPRTFGVTLRYNW